MEYFAFLEGGCGRSDMSDRNAVFYAALLAKALII
jgi:hypothetical protein